MSALLTNAILLSLFIFSLAMVLTVIRLFKGPSAQDRVLALDYLYILAMLMMLVLGIRYASDTYFEGALLIALHMLVEFGALSIIGLQTFTTAIYQQFELEFSNANAAMLSAVLLVMCLTLLWLELRVRDASGALSDPVRLEIVITPVDDEAPRIAADVLDAWELWPPHGTEHAACQLIAGDLCQHLDFCHINRDYMLILPINQRLLCKISAL